MPEREWRYEDEDGKYFSVTEVLKYSGLSKDYSGIPARIMRRASARGTCVHAIMEDLCVGKDPNMEEIEGVIGHLCKRDGWDFDKTMDRWQGYIDAGRAWVDKMKPRVHVMELFVKSPEFRVAGRMDLFSEVNSEDWTIDFKTRETDAVDALQLAGYKNLLTRHYAFAGEDELAVRAANSRRAVVSLLRDGSWKMCEYTGPDDVDTFLAAARTTWWKWEHGRL